MKLSKLKLREKHWMLDNEKQRAKRKKRIYLPILWKALSKQATSTYT